MTGLFDFNGQPHPEEGRPSTRFCLTLSGPWGELRGAAKAAQDEVPVSKEDPVRRDGEIGYQSAAIW